jgi:asparagine synthase (glutamine-hydrolysing)
MGGIVPTPKPELQNLLARGRFVRLARQLNAWAAKMRKPRLALLYEALRGFVISTPLIVLDPTRLHSCFDLDFVRRNRATIRGYSSRVKLFGPAPSFQDNMTVLVVIRRILTDFHLRPELLGETRYPYLDRDLMEFMYAIPREQVVGVGKRRFLMKRALVGIDPDEIIGRRQQPFTPSVNAKQDSTEWDSLLEIGHHMVSGDAGIIDRDRFLETLRKTQATGATMGGFDRILELESWLRHLTAQGIRIDLPLMKREESLVPLKAEKFLASAQPKSSAS